MSRKKWGKKLNNSLKTPTTRGVVRPSKKKIQYYEVLLVQMDISYTLKRSSRGKFPRVIINTADGKFDSGLECYCYYRLKQENISFEFQKKYVLQPSKKINIENQYVENGRNIRTIPAITLTPDFEAVKDDTLFIVDTKGQQTPQNRLRFKMLEYSFLTEGKLYKMLLPQSQTEVEEVIKKLLQ